MIEVDDIIYVKQGLDNAKLNMDIFPYEGLQVMERKIDIKVRSHIIGFNSSSKYASLGNAKLKCKAGEVHATLLLFARLQRKLEERSNISKDHIFNSLKLKNKVTLGEGKSIQVVLSKHAYERAIQRHIAWEEVSSHIKSILPYLKLYCNTKPVCIMSNLCVVLRKFTAKKVMIITLFYDDSNQSMLISNYCGRNLQRSSEVKMIGINLMMKE